MFLNSGLCSREDWVFIRTGEESWNYEGGGEEWRVGDDIRAVKKVENKDPLLVNSDDLEMDDNEIALHEDDVHISTDDPYLDICFSKRVHGLTDQSMHQMLIFANQKDYDKVLVGGSWMVYGHYLIVQPWNHEFSTKVSHLSKIVA
ncbi:hypothetical protein Gotri_007483 [Gossypium trilobum]|uniref:DUF4283 domain-containing protein n=1 Tax=Gossypium trilobum TaxID=34281 RepID=A0A7J9EGY7_9ROSI|nr:hypothetical protein [Gossypium trilobum]